MKKLSLEAAAGVYSGTAHDAKPHPIHIERNKAFKAGAEWQRNHVWHKCTEQPKDSSLVLVMKGNVGFIAGPNHEGWEDTVKHLGLEAWVYLDDLLPTSFDEILEANKDALQRLKDK